MPFRGKDIRDIRKRHTREFLNSLPDFYNKVNIRNQLQALLNWAYDNEDIEKPIKIPTIKVAEKPIEWLDAEQQAEILAYIPEHDKPVYIFIITYGCRPGEARALLWDCVDFRHDEIHPHNRNMIFSIRIELNKRRFWMGLEFPKDYQNNIPLFFLKGDYVKEKLDDIFVDGIISIHENIILKWNRNKDIKKIILSIIRMMEKLKIDEKLSVR